MSKIVQNAAGLIFRPLPPIRAARNMTLMVARLVLVGLAASRLDGWLSLALWIAAAAQASTLLIVAFITEKVNAERERRLNALPAPWLAFLRDGGAVPR